MVRYDDKMRIGYGYKRTASQFRKLDVEKLYIDTDKSDRYERSSMFQIGLREGDTLVMLKAGDIGHGNELPLFAKRIKKMDVTVEIAEAAPPKPRGRPSTFKPDATQDKRYRDWWYGEVYMSKHIVERVSEDLGKPVTISQLDHRYGPRDGSMPKGRKGRFKSAKKPKS